MFNRFLIEFEIFHQFIYTILDIYLRAGCVYILEARKGKRVHLTLFLVNIACYYGGLEISEGNGTLIHNFCGNNLHNVEVSWLDILRFSHF